MDGMQRVETPDSSLFLHRASFVSLAETVPLCVPSYSPTSPPHLHCLSIFTHLPPLYHSHTFLVSHSILPTIHPCLRRSLVSLLVPDWCLYVPDETYDRTILSVCPLCLLSCSGLCKPALSTVPQVHTDAEFSHTRCNDLQQCPARILDHLFRDTIVSSNQELPRLDVQRLCKPRQSRCQTDLEMSAMLVV